MVHIGDFDGRGDGIGLLDEYRDDPRWPVKCDHCGQPFDRLPAQAPWQVFIDPIYFRRDTGQQAMFRQWMKIAGATWDADWLHDLPEYCGPDGRSLVTVCPCGEHWCIDGPATNCTMKEEHVHKCWVRHGDIENMTVDKNGFTCAAGGGSIQTKQWHGFLRGGFLVDG